MTNIILYTVDCLRVDAVNEKLTPNIMKLAEEGVTFTNAFTCSGYTGYSCASIMSGLLPHCHGYDWVDNKIRGDVRLLPEILSSSGYKTFGLVGVDLIIGSMQGFDRGFGEFKVMVDWVDEALNIIEGEDDFFLWGHYFDIHNVFGNDAYDFHVKEMDDRLIGKTVASLGDKIDDTLIVVTADHGEGLNAHGFLGHDSPYDEVVRIPLVFRGKGVDVGRVERNLVRSIDVAPTILELVGLDMGGEVDGMPVLPSTPRNNEAYFYNIYFEDERGYRCLRRGKWKLIEFFFKDDESRYELYDIPSDLQEADDVASKHPDVVEELKERLSSILGSGVKSDKVSEVEEKEIRERLRGLGYM